MFQMGTLSFQTSQLTRSSKDIQEVLTPSKCFLGKLGDRYSFKKKQETQHDGTPSSVASVNDIMEAVMVWENNPSTQDSVQNATDEDGLMELFDQFSGLMSPMLDWLDLDTVVISEVSLQGKCTTYQVTVQSIITSALIDTGANILVISEKFSSSLPQTPHLLQVHMYKVKSADGANLGPITQCELTFRLGKNNLLRGL